MSLHRDFRRVVNMTHIVPTAGIIPTSLAFWASVLPYHHIGSLMSLLYPHNTHLSMQFLALKVSGDYYTYPPGIVHILMLTITYIQVIALHIHTQDRFNNHTLHSLYRIMVMATNDVGVMKMGNSVSRAGIKPISLVFWAMVLPFTQHRLPDVTSIPMPTCLCSSLPQRSGQTTTILSCYAMYIFARTMQLQATL